MKKRSTRREFLTAAVAGSVLGGIGYRLISPVRPEGFTAALPEGPEFVLYYIGAQACGYSTSRANVDALSVGLERFREACHERGAAAVLHGIAIDWTPTVGLEHLSMFGLWDEVSLGRNWANSMLLRISDLHSSRGTPAVAVHRRTVVTPVSEYRPAFAEEQEVFSIRGVSQISRWVDAGASPTYSPPSYDGWIL